MTNRINHKNANNLQFLWLELHKKHLEQKVILPLTSPLDINVPTGSKLASYALLTACILYDGPQ